MPSKNGNFAGIQALVSSRCALETLEIAKLSYFWKLVTINRVSPRSLNYLSFQKKRNSSIIQVFFN